MVFNFRNIENAIKEHDAEFLVEVLKEGDSLARFTCLGLILDGDWFPDLLIHPTEGLCDDYSPVLFGEPLLIYANACLQKFGIKEYSGEYKKVVDMRAA